MTFNSDKKKLNQNIIYELLTTNANYLLLKYFNNAETTVRIFQGLTKYYINQQNIEIIYEVWVLRL